jgi:hypothetical protein
LRSIFKNCPKTDFVTVTAAKEHVSEITALGKIPTWLTNMDFAPCLRFLEFCGIYVDPERRQVLGTLTKRGAALEIVFEYDSDLFSIRDGQNVPFSELTDDGFTIASADNRTLHSLHPMCAFCEAFEENENTRMTKAEEHERDKYHRAGPAAGGPSTITIDGCEVEFEENVIAFNPEVRKRCIQLSRK